MTRGKFGDGRRVALMLGPSLFPSFPPRRLPLPIPINRNSISPFAHSLQGKGYGPEALSWLVEQAFHRHNLHRIEGEVFDFNEAALKAYEKVGFVVEGRKRESMWQEGRYRDEVIV